MAEALEAVVAGLPFGAVRLLEPRGGLEPLGDDAVSIEEHVPEALADLDISVVGAIELAGGRHGRSFGFLVLANLALPDRGLRIRAYALGLERELAIGEGLADGQIPDVLDLRRSIPLAAALLVVLLLGSLAHQPVLHGADLGDPRLVYPGDGLVLASAEQPGLL